MHLHTTRSDGSKSPVETMEIYKSRGYDFIAITDHDIYWGDDSYNTGGFCVLGGIEIGLSYGGKNYDLGAYFDPGSKYAKNRLPHDYSWSVSSLDGNSMPEFYSAGSSESEIIIYDVVRKAINFLKKHGNIVMINHPDFSRHLPEDNFNFKEAFAMEIYNHSAEINRASGYSIEHYDEALRSGMRCLGIAADDFHGNTDHIGGWIMVSANSLDPADLIAAIKEGSFYSTTGPEIHDFYVNDNMVYAETSPVREISFITYPDHGLNFKAPAGAFLHRAAAELDEKEKVDFIRLEITDAHGMKAWSNPIFIKD